MRSSVGTIRSTLMNRLRRGRSQQQVVEVEVGPEELAVAAGVAAVEVHERGVELERRRGDERLAVVVGRDRPCAAGRSSIKRSEPSPTRVGRNGTRHAAACSPSRNSPSSYGSSSTAPDWRAARKWGSSGIESSDTKRVHRSLDLARRAQQPEVGTGVAHDGQVADVRSEDRADDRHRLAARTPAADADRHARAQLGNDLVFGHSLVRAHVVVSVFASLDERVAMLVGHARQVQLEGEALARSGSCASRPTGRCRSATPSQRGSPSATWPRWRVRPRTRRRAARPSGRHCSTEP